MSAFTDRVANYTEKTHRRQHKRQSRKRGHQGAYFTWAGVGAIVAAVALAAFYIPARRAMGSIP